MSGVATRMQMLRSLLAMAQGYTQHDALIK
jgi:hypothetical protein